MSNKVKEYFKKAGLADRIQVFDTSSATVELAAAAINCHPSRIAKTLSFMVEQKPILIVVSGDAKIDNPKYKAQFGTKATMLKPDQTLELIGLEIGGICPFAIKDGVTVYLDKSLQRFETVYPACGSSNSVLELSIQELEQHSNSIAWIDVCKGWKY